MTEADEGEVLRRLAGSWKGVGSADFPSIGHYDYSEELRLEWDSARSGLVYDQRAVLADGSPSHRELGFIRLMDDGQVQLTNSQNNGRCEALRGELTVSPTQIIMQLASVEFANDPRMLASTRTLRLEGDTLSYEMGMQTTTVESSTPLPHLTATLRRRG